MKKIWPFLLAALLLVLMIVAYLNRTPLNNFISKKMKEQAGTEAALSVEKLIDSKYNYSKNTQNFDFTLFEFGSTGCAICKQMEPVLEEMRNLEKPKVNVVFLHIMHPENLPMMKYYGISAVPMQVLLDKNGKEFFRNYGFISARELMNKLKNS